MAEMLGIVGGVAAALVMGEGLRRHALGRLMERQFALARVRVDQGLPARRED